MDDWTTEDGTDSASGSGTPELTPIEGVSITSQVIYDEEGVRITATEIGESWSGIDLALHIENYSNRDIMVQAKDSSVNGYMVYGLMSPDIEKGKSVNASIRFDSDKLEECDIEKIAVMEFRFHIIDLNTWDTIKDSDMIRVETTAAADYVQDYQNDGKVIFDSKGIKIVEMGISVGDDIWGPSAVFYIENTSDRNIGVQTRDVSVNGIKVDAIISEEIVAGKKAVAHMQFMQDEFDENGIEEINDIELCFHFFNWDSYENILTTEPIKIEY